MNFAHVIPITPILTFQADMNQYRCQLMQKSITSFCFTFSVEFWQLYNHENQTELQSFGLEESYKLVNEA